MTEMAQERPEGAALGPPQADRLSIVYFAGCDWWYHPRGLFCTQIARRLGRGNQVLFVNSLGMRMPSLRADAHALGKIARKARSMLRYLRHIENHFYVMSPVSLPVYHRPILGRINRMGLIGQVRVAMRVISLHEPVVIVGCPPAWEIAQRLPHSFLVYQRTDIFEEMPGADRDYITACHEALLQRADLVLYVNQDLFQAERSGNRNCLMVGHGVDYDLFAQATEAGRRPLDIAAIPAPRIGFFGDVTTDACDLELIEYAAQALADMSFVFVGPISADVTSLRRYPNIHFLGLKPYEEIPNYGAAFDVAIMPWKKNRWIQFCNPVKIKEYLALGKPVVSIDYPALDPFRDVCYAVQGTEDFVAAVRQALREDGPGLKKRRQEKVAGETWDAKASLIEAAIREGLKKGPHGSHLKD